jgi:tRNA threonylcarbamoyladenosine biosynthesis protein TsaE
MLRIVAAVYARRFSRYYSGMQVRTESAAETRGLGVALARAARAGDVLWLHGELGAGKTELTKGLAEGLACTAPVSSPSFALIHEYGGGRLPLYHADLYRLEGGAAVDLGLEEYLEGAGVTAVEWGERLPETFFNDGLDLTLSDDGEDARIAMLEPRGPAGAGWLARAFEGAA